MRALSAAALLLTAGCPTEANPDYCTSEDDCGEGVCDLGLNRCADSTDGGADGHAGAGELGADCEAASDCQSGFCAGGVCCAEACDGLCEACDPKGECVAAADDDACEVVVCHAATECSAASDIETQRCAKKGACKTASDCQGQPIDGPCGAGFLCAEGACPTSCTSNPQCAAGLCDESSGECPAATDITEVDCGADSAALQDAIDACPGAERCYLRLAAGSICSAIQVEGPNVYIGGAEGVEIEGSFFVSPVTVDNAVTTSVVLADLSLVRGNEASGLKCEGTSTDHPVVELHHVTIGSEAQGDSNDEFGVITDRCHLRIYDSLVLGNGTSGIEARGGCTKGCEAVIERTVVTQNRHTGAVVDDVQSFRMTNTAVVGNALVVAAPHNGVHLTNLTPLEFAGNTVVANAKLGTGVGILCEDSAIDMDLMLVWDNGDSEEDGVVGCGSLSSSHVQNDPQTCGVGLDPELDADNIHLAPDSPCIDAAKSCGEAVVAGGLTGDIDGDARPTGLLCDPGADEAAGD